jgi:uncharacterized membrane protein
MSKERSRVMKKFWATLDLLNERCARGEINQAEYEGRKRLLKA